MWPWGHLAAGYLLYRGLDRTRVPDAMPVLALALGTQLPDLIDKPLAWTIPLLPNGRSFGHSLVIAFPILVGLLLLTDGRRRRLVIALATGYLTHLGTDALYPALDGNWYYVGFLGWPIVPPIEYPGESTGIVSHFLTFELTLTSGFEIGLLAGAVLLWLRDHKPGWEAALHTVQQTMNK
jgi:membrane-bound metal-dependent hydrolase YbcI (DUF457 family)